METQLNIIENRKPQWVLTDKFLLFIFENKTRLNAISQLLLQSIEALRRDATINENPTEAITEA